MDLIDIGLYASYLLFVVCAITAVVLPIVQSMSNPQSLVKSAIGVGVLLVVFLIGYIMADDASDVVSAGMAKLVGAGIISMYIFLFLAVVGIVYTEISKILSNLRPNPKNGISYKKMCKFIRKNLQILKILHAKSFSFH